MDLGNSRYPQNIINLENENDANHLLNSEDSLVNQLINNKKKNKFLSQNKKEEYPNIFEIKFKKKK